MRELGDNKLWSGGPAEAITSYTVDRIRQFEQDVPPNLASPITTEQRASWQRIPAFATRDCDLLVAGGGLGGVACALAAARRGLKVIIVEPTHLLGGQATAGGVSAFDITFEFDHLLNDFGIWGELIERILTVYDDELSRPVNVGHYRNSSITPNICVVERVLGEMLADCGVEVLRNTGLCRALFHFGRSRLGGIYTTAGPIRAKLTVDATEDGQVLALAQVPYRVGNAIAIDGLGMLADDQGGVKIQDITYTALIRHYPDGIPEELRLTRPPPGYDDLLPILRRHFPEDGVEDPIKRKAGPLGFAGFRAAPDLAASNMHVGVEWTRASRTSLNHINDYPVNAAYLESPVGRRQAEAKAICKTLCIIYYLQNELQLDWSVCTDEGLAESPVPRFNIDVPEVYREVVRHFPPIPYIRESRRLCGTYTLTGKDINRPHVGALAEWRVDSIAVGTYHPDLHGGRTADSFETDLGESLADKPTSWRIGPFPIPLGCLVPSEEDGLIVAEKNLSASRIAASACRLHPTVVATGEAAGVLAVLALTKGRRPRDVPAGAVQYELARGGAQICQLPVEGVHRGDVDFALVSLAVARERLPYEVLRRKGVEPTITVDRNWAREAGLVSRQFLKEWLLP